MKPSLPQQDRDPSARRASLARDREFYGYNTDYHDLIFASQLAPSDDYTLAYVAGVIALKTRLAADLAAGLKPRAMLDVIEQSIESHGTDGVIAALRQIQRDSIDGSPAVRATSIDDYDHLYRVIPRPVSYGRWRDDAFFAWQRLTGGNPTVIQRLDRVPDNLALTEASYDRVVSGRDRLAAALAQGRIYVTDYAILDGTPVGKTTGFEKFLWAPIAVFAQTPWGEFLPVGIQCGQRPDAETPLYTPADGARWDMAKMVAQVADINWQGTCVHLGYCHLILESVILGSRRQLASNHPLRVLLEPHFEMTLMVNKTAREGLINPGGYMDILQSGTLDGSIGILKRGMASLHLDRSGPFADLSARGVDDVEALPVYPYRDDGVPIAKAIQRWVDGYLRRYYTTDADIVADTELAAWRDELAAQDGGRLVGVPTIDSIASLIEFVTHLIFRCTAYHATINYSGYDCAGYPPNMPTAAFGPGPSPSRDATDATLLAMMPPLNVARGAFTLMYTLLETRHNQLGQYAHDAFSDAGVAPLLKTFQEELRQIETDTNRRNESRLLPYPFLIPSRIPQSIHV